MGRPSIDPNLMIRSPVVRYVFAIERIKPGHPQQNGRHEEATRPPALNSLQQQDRFDTFVREFNTERPHEALDMH
jgi:transposase InsO family protein